MDDASPPFVDVAYARAKKITECSNTSVSPFVRRWKERTKLGLRKAKKAERIRLEVEALQHSLFSNRVIQL